MERGTLGAMRWITDPRPVTTRHLRMYRLLALSVVAAVVLYHVVAVAAGAETPTERLGYRVPVVLAWGTLYGLTLGSAWVRDRLARLVHLLCYVTALRVLQIAAAAHFAGERIFVLVLVVFGTALIFRRAREQLIFYGVMLSATTLGVVLRPPTEVHPALVVAILATVMALSIVVTKGREDASVELEELGLVASSVHNGVVLTDGAGRIHWVNDAFVELSGRTLDRLAGLHIADALAGPSTGRETLDQLRDAIANGRKVQVELAHHRPDRDPVWVALDLTPVLAHDGHVDRFIAIEVDITRAHAYLAQILDSMTDLLLVVEKDRGVRTANIAACRLLGVSEAEMLGAPLEQLLHEAQPGDGAERLRALLDDKDVPPAADVDLNPRTWVGSPLPVQASAVVLRSDAGQARRLVVTARDIRERLRMADERRLLQDRVQQAQKLESLGVLAGGIAHDFNNLLVGMLGNTSLALQEMSGDHPARQLVQRAESAATRAAELTRQMLDYSGKGRFHLEVVELPTVAKEMADLLEASISKKAHLAFDFDPAVPAVEGDPAQLRQVIMNLITNAADALAGEEGVVTLRTGHMHADREWLDSTWLAEGLPEGDYAFLEVTDTGDGMDLATRQRMFDPFFSTKAHGRGLGLAATLGIVRSHKGAIRVVSEPGSGTCIRIVLPPAERVPSGRTAAPSPDPDWSGAGTVLVADDEPEVLRFVSRVLSRAGFEVVEATDGAEALERFVGGPDRFDLIVLDLSMPRMSGEEAFAEMRARRADVPVLITSGYDEQEALARFDRADAGIGFLGKPYRVGELLARVRQLVDTPEQSDESDTR